MVTLLSWNTCSIVENDIKILWHSKWQKISHVLPKENRNMWYPASSNATVACWWALVENRNVQKRTSAHTHGCRLWLTCPTLLFLWRPDWLAHRRKRTQQCCSAGSKSRSLDPAYTVHTTWSKSEDKHVCSLKSYRNPLSVNLTWLAKFWLNKTNLHPATSILYKFKEDRAEIWLNSNEKTCLQRLACFRDDSTAIQPPLQYNKLVLFQQLGWMRINWDRESHHFLSRRWHGFRMQGRIPCESHISTALRDQRKHTDHVWSLLQRGKTITDATGLKLWCLIW